MIIAVNFPIKAIGKKKPEKNQGFFVSAIDFIDFIIFHYAFKFSKCRIILQFTILAIMQMFCVLNDDHDFSLTFLSGFIVMSHLLP